MLAAQPMVALALDGTTLAGRYAAGDVSPTDVVADVWDRIARRGDDGVWIARAGRDPLLAAARALAQRKAAGEPLPLYGLPFAVKDNIDVAGVPTTAACPVFAYTPDADAPAVARLRAAGALFVGKTNLDQFATGLTGVRTPYGVPRNTFDDRYVAGGSSSGSAVAVAAGLVSFALGTDTAGSGRVPAAFNNIVGWKPSRGIISTVGVVPACPSFDCVSVFAPTVEDAAHVARIAGAAPAADAGPPGDRPPRFRFGVPGGLDFLGDAAAAEVFERATQRLAALGGIRVEIELAPFRAAGALLYDGPFVAERLIAAGRLFDDHPDALLAPIRAILAGAARFDARAAFAARYTLARLRRRVAPVFADVDFLLVPTTPTIYRIDQIEADPFGPNASLGAYTNFVNLLDLAAVAVPTGLRRDGLPAGATLVGAWGSERRLAPFASALHRATSELMGATELALPPPDPAPPPPPGWISIAVVGAHLSGEPLNHQLTDAGGRFVCAARTTPRYRLYALPNTSPPKPGLARVDAGGSAIELEVWALPPAAFGAFVARVPAPLCIGSIELADRRRVSGFLCEGHALAGAPDVSRFGGWRDYRRSLGQTVG